MWYKFVDTKPGNRAGIREEGKIQALRSGTGTDGTDMRLKSDTKTFRRKGSTKKTEEHFCFAAPAVPRRGAFCGESLETGLTGKSHSRIPEQAVRAELLPDGQGPIRQAETEETAETGRGADMSGSFSRQRGRQHTYKKREPCSELPPAGSLIPSCRLWKGREGSRGS